MRKYKLSTFLSTYPLYKRFKAIENYDGNLDGYTSPYELKGETFPYYCDSEEKETTFEVELPKFASDFWGHKRGDTIPQEVFDKDSHLNYVQHLVCYCKSCKTFHIDLLLHVWSNKPMPNNIHQARINYHLGSKVKGVSVNDNFLYDIYMEKIGVGPEQRVLLDKDVVKYLDRESGSWYFKGSKALAESYGIGAFAYFRRIVEKELIKIVQDLSKLTSAESDKIQNLLVEYEKTGKVYLLYKNVFNFLPNSLKALGDNPLEILYKHTSEGLHEMSDEDCLDRAGVVNQVLTFVIRKIYEERSEILTIRNAIKKLKAKGQ